jgi:ABC-2 type transport system permease protein
MKYERMPNTLRVIYSAFRMAMLYWMADPQWIIPNVIAPFVFTTVALTLFNAYGGSSGPFGLYAVLGGGMMGMWGNTIYSSGFAISFEKWQGTLEEVMAAPSKFIHVIAGRSISNALFGLTNMVAVFIVGIFVFKISLGISDPVLFTISLLLTLFSVSALGLIFASAFVLSRSAQTLTNGLETPLYIISGSMFPIALLPFWSHPFAYILGPTWGIDAIRLTTSQQYASQTFWAGMGTSSALFLDLTVMILITAAYVAIATVLFKMVETRARTMGTLVEA